MVCIEPLGIELEAELLGRVGGLRHFMELRDGEPSGPERSRGGLDNNKDTD
jgi:hypothetical protein